MGASKKIIMSRIFALLVAKPDFISDKIYPDLSLLNIMRLFEIITEDIDRSKPEHFWLYPNTPQIRDINKLTM